MSHTLKSLCFLAFMLSQHSTATADMILSIREVGNDLSFNLQGSIDTSALPRGPGFASYNGSSGGAYGHGGFSDGASTALSTTQSIGDVYSFNDDQGLTRVGSWPTYSVPAHSVLLSQSIWYGFTDATRLLSSSITDWVIVPDGYVSGDYLDISFVEPNRSFRSLFLTPGNLWGVSFDNGAGGVQSMLFHAVPVPEPSSALLLTLGSVFLGSVRFRSLPALC